MFTGSGTAVGVRTVLKQHVNNSKMFVVLRTEY